MARVTPEEFAEKHARRLKAAEPDIRRGIERVTIAPGKLAGAKQDKMQAKLNESINDGTWKRRVEGVSLDTWKDKTLKKGVPRIAAGIDAAHDKQVAFANQLLPAVDAAKAAIKDMPDLTLDDNINRSAAYLRIMGKFRKK